MNKKLLRSVREYKKQSVLAPILVILEVLMEVLIPLEMAKIIDVGIANGDMSYIIQRGVILVAMAMLSLFFGVQAGNMAAVAAAGYAKNLRHDIFYKVQDFSFKNIDHFSTSGLVTRLTTDITNVQQAYMMSIRLLARAPFMIILSWIMTLTINKPIAVLFLIVVPVLGGTLIFIAKKAHPHFIKVFDEYDNLNNSVQENVNASRVVKAFVREDYEIEKFHGISRYVYNLFTKAEKIVAWNSPVMMFVMYTVIIIIVAIGGRGIVLGGMETGELTSIIVYVPLKVSGPFHSPLLKEAGKELGEELKSVELSELQIPYVTNVTAEYVSEIDQTKALLAKQVAASVRWQQSIEKMLSQGVDTFIEIGPGRTLTGFMRKISREVRTSV